MVGLGVLAGRCHTHGPRWRRRTGATVLIAPEGEALARYQPSQRYYLLDDRDLWGERTASAQSGVGGSAAREQPFAEGSQAGDGCARRLAPGPGEQEGAQAFGRRVVPAGADAGSVRLAGTAPDAAVGGGAESARWVGSRYFKGVGEVAFGRRGAIGFQAERSRARAALIPKRARTPALSGPTRSSQRWPR